MKPQQVRKKNQLEMKNEIKQKPKESQTNPMSVHKTQPSKNNKKQQLNITQQGKNNPESSTTTTATKSKSPSKAEFFLLCFGRGGGGGSGGRGGATLPVLSPLSHQNKVGFAGPILSFKGAMSPRPASNFFIINTSDSA